MDRIEPQPHSFRLGPLRLPAVLRIPHKPKGLIVFAHGSGSSHRSPRNNQVAEALTAANFATLLFDLLTVSEEEDRRKVFNIELLAARLIDAIERILSQPSLANLPVGLFGASTGAGAALLAASNRPDLINAVVSRGGRPDLAGKTALENVQASSLFIVGGADEEVIKLNRAAARLMHCRNQIVIIPGAGHLFEEPGTLGQVIDYATRWFEDHLIMKSPPFEAEPILPFKDRKAAGLLLCKKLEHLRENDPIVLALPRGGLPVAFEIAKGLHARLELLLVRKLGAPQHIEFAIGAVVDGEEPQLILNEEAIQAIAPSREYIQQELDRQLVELERRRRAYLGARRKPHLTGRNLIIVDDGIATGSTITAAVRGVRRAQPKHLVLAVPVAPADVVSKLRPLCDEIVVLATPEPFFAVGRHYRDFRQIEDAEVIELLHLAEQSQRDSR